MKKEVKRKVISSETKIEEHIAKSYSTKSNITYYNLLINFNIFFFWKQIFNYNIIL